MTVAGPDINTLVELDVAGWVAPRRSRVEGLDDELVVADPLVDGADREPPIGSPVTVSWMGPPGPMELTTSLAAKEQRTIRMWRLQPEGPVVITQRRHHVRVATVSALVLHTGRRPVDGYLVDLSEGGLRVVCPGRPPLSLGARVDATLDVRDQTITVAAEVVRVADDGERTSAGLRFVDVPSIHTDAIRRFVFARQRQERASR